MACNSEMVGQEDFVSKEWYDNGAPIMELLKAVI